MEEARGPVISNQLVGSFICIVMDEFRAPLSINGLKTIWRSRAVFSALGNGRDERVRSFSDTGIAAGKPDCSSLLAEISHGNRRGVSWFAEIYRTFRHGCFLSGGAYDGEPRRHCLFPEKCLRGIAGHGSRTRNWLRESANVFLRSRKGSWRSARGVFGFTEKRSVVSGQWSVVSGQCFSASVLQCFSASVLQCFSASVCFGGQMADVRWQMAKDTETLKH